MKDIFKNVISKMYVNNSNALFSPMAGSQKPMI